MPAGRSRQGGFAGFASRLREPDVNGKPLFPGQRAYTEGYPLSASEALLYMRVAGYVRRPRPEDNTPHNPDGTAEGDLAG